MIGSKSSPLQPRAGRIERQSWSFGERRGKGTQHQRNRILDPEILSKRKSVHFFQLPPWKSFYIHKYSLTNKITFKSFFICIILKISEFNYNFTLILIIFLKKLNNYELAFFDRYNSLNIPSTFPNLPFIVIFRCLYNFNLVNPFKL